MFKSHIVEEIALPPSQVYHDPQQISSTQASVQTLSDVRTSASLTTSGPEPVSTNNPSGMVTQVSNFRFYLKKYLIERNIGPIIGKRKSSKLELAVTAVSW